MMSDFLDWYPFVILVGLALVGVSRAILMFRRGINVLVPDRGRSRAELVLDALLAPCLLLFFWQVLAFSLAIPFHLGKGFLGDAIYGHSWLRWVGVMVGGLSLFVYGKGVLDLGLAWRFSIDRTSDAPLVDTGIYAVCRHPIYVSFDLFIVGIILLMGQVIFLVLGIILVPLLHLQMLREERFLRKHYGAEYDAYCLRVRRYVFW